MTARDAAWRRFSDASDAWYNQPSDETAEAARQAYAAWLATLAD